MSEEQSQEKPNYQQEFLDHLTEDEKEAFREAKKHESEMRDIVRQSAANIKSLNEQAARARHEHARLEGEWRKAYNRRSRLERKVALMKIKERI